MKNIINKMRVSGSSFIRSKPALLVILSIVVIIISGTTLFSMRDKQSDNVTATKANLTEEQILNDPALLSQEGLHQNGVRYFKWVIKDGKVVEGPANLVVKQNQEINIEFVSQNQDGGDTRVALEDHLVASEVFHVPNSQASMVFVADKIGTFKFQADTEIIKQINGEESEDTLSGVIGTIKVEAN